MTFSTRTGSAALSISGTGSPTVPDSVIEELQECFEQEEPMLVEDRLCRGMKWFSGDGAFVGIRAFVLRVLPARQRVQVLLDILGRPTTVEVDRSTVSLETRSNGGPGAAFGRGASRVVAG